MALHKILCANLKHDQRKSSTGWVAQMGEVELADGVDPVAAVGDYICEACTDAWRLAGGKEQEAAAKENRPPRRINPKTELPEELEVVAAADETVSERQSLDAQKKSLDERIEDAVNAPVGKPSTGSGSKIKPEGE